MPHPTDLDKYRKNIGLFYNKQQKNNKISHFRNPLANNNITDLLLLMRLDFSPEKSIDYLPDRNFYKASSRDGKYIQIFFGITLLLAIRTIPLASAVELSHSIQENNHGFDIQKNRTTVFIDNSNSNEHNNFNQAQSQPINTNEENIYGKNYPTYQVLLNAYDKDQTITSAEALKIFFEEICQETSSSHQIKSIKFEIDKYNKFINNQIDFLLNKKIEKSSGSSKLELIKLIKKARKMSLAKRDIDFVLDNTNFRIHIYDSGLERMTGGYARDGLYIPMAPETPKEFAGILVWKTGNQDISLLIHEFHHMAVNYAHYIISSEGKNIEPYFPIDQAQTNQFRTILTSGEKKIQEFKTLLKKGNDISSEESKLLKTYKTAIQTFSIPGNIPIYIAEKQAKLMKTGNLYNLDREFGVKFGDVKIEKKEKKSIGSYLVYVSPTNKINAFLNYCQIIESNLVDYPQQDYFFEKEAYLRQYFSTEIIETFYPGLISKAENLLSCATQKIQRNHYQQSFENDMTNVNLPKHRA